MTKRLLALFLALVFVAMMGICAAAEDDAELYGYDEPVYIKIGHSIDPTFQYKEGEDIDNNQWAYLYKEHNIFPVVLYDVDSTQAATKLSTAIMSGDYPDILAANPTTFINYAKTGVIADITDVFEEYASDYLKEYLNADGGLALKNCMVNGRLYGIPEMTNSYDSVPEMWIRLDWLENLGLEIPTTVEDFMAVAHAFTYDDPDQNGIDDTYGLAINGVDVLHWGPGDISAVFAMFNAFPGTDGLAFVENEQGEVIWGGANVEGMKATLQMLQDMYNDGSVSKVFTTMNYNSILEEVSAGRCGIWFGPMWSSMVPASDAIKSQPDCHMIAARIPSGLGETMGKAYLTSSVSNIFCVSSKCANPEVIIKLLNLSVQKLCYPESAEEYIRYYGGAESPFSGSKCSLTQTLAPLKNLDNFKKESEALRTGDTSILNTEQLGDYNNMRAYLDGIESGVYDVEDPVFSGGVGYYTVFGDPQGAYALIDRLIAEGGYTPSAYNSFPTEAMAENGETLKKLTVETIVKIITGAPVDSYDEFLTTWYTLGGEEIIADVQTWAEANR